MTYPTIYGVCILDKRRKVGYAVSDNSLLNMFRGCDFVSVIGAYMDESGHETDPNTPITVVGGAYANHLRWKYVEYGWKKILEDAHVTYFHSKELEHRRGEYTGWDEEKKNAFLKKLTSIVVNEQLHIFAMAVEHRDYEIAKVEFPKIKMDAYQFCCAACLIPLLRRFGRNRHIEYVAFMFEDGRKFTTKVISFLDKVKKAREHKNVNPGFRITKGDKKSYIPLQVADLVAYELFQMDKCLRASPQRPMRKSLQILQRKISPDSGGIITLDETRDFLTLIEGIINKEWKA